MLTHNISSWENSHATANLKKRRTNNHILCLTANCDLSRTVQRQIIVICLIFFVYRCKFWPHDDDTGNGQAVTDVLIRLAQAQVFPLISSHARLCLLCTRCMYIRVTVTLQIPCEAVTWLLYFSTFVIEVKTPGQFISADPPFTDYTDIPLIETLFPFVFL